MTDLDLQEAIINELKEMAAHHSLKKLNGEEWTEYNIYRQDKPYKDDPRYTDEFDPMAPDVQYGDEQEDYMIVMIDDEDTDSNGRWIVQVHILISVALNDREKVHQGNLIVANLMNQIDLWFCKKGIIGKKYEMEPERKKRFNHECYPEYAECAYMTKWKLPAANIEGIEDLI